MSKKLQDKEGQTNKRAEAEKLKGTGKRTGLPQTAVGGYTNCTHIYIWQKKCHSERMKAKYYRQRDGTGFSQPQKPLVLVSTKTRQYNVNSE